MRNRMAGLKSSRHPICAARAAWNCDLAEDRDVFALNHRLGGHPTLGMSAFGAKRTSVPVPKMSGPEPNVRSTATRGSYRTRRSRRAGRPLELRRVNQCPPSVLMQINVFCPQAAKLYSRIRADGGKTCSQVITSQKDLSRR